MRGKKNTGTSHPTRVRGLKPSRGWPCVAVIRVAPHAGAWIETEFLMGRRSGRDVAPHAGAWIETRNTRRGLARHEVAPHAGAWIETLSASYATLSAKPSHPTRVRGLKHSLREIIPLLTEVAPHAGAWIETEYTGRSVDTIRAVAPHAGAWIETTSA